MTSSPARSCFAIELLALATMVGCVELDALCETAACQLTEGEWSRISALTNLGDPAPDPANKYVGVPAAEVLGQKLYFDPRVSGVGTRKDGLGRTVTAGRAAVGQPIDISCASCHDPARGGSDYTSVPGHVSIGAGMYDVNSMTTINSAYYKLKYWNGRYDSLVWQILAVAESGVSMNGDRVAIMRLLFDHYRAEFDGVFTEHPLPDFGRSAEAQAGLLEADGQCRLDQGACPTAVECAEADGGCWPRWPLHGKPGKKAGCDRSDASEPFGDAFDCMSETDRETTVRTYVNFAKAIAAYEYLLISRNAPLDRWVTEGPDSAAISDAAKRGARLFVGKAACIECHLGPLMSDDDFHNIGVPQLGEGVPRESDCPAGDPSCDCSSGAGCKPWGAFVGLKKLQAGSTFRIDSTKYSDDPSDRSRQAFYERPITDSLRGAWRTPGLREISRSAPYMHNGYYRTLEEVVRHYNQGGTKEGAATDQRSVRVAPLQLTDGEVADLVAFLRSLDGEPLPRTLVTAPALPGL